MEDDMKFSGIGGQAVMEGVMMKNKDHYAVAVRKEDGEIEVKVNDCVSIKDTSKVGKIPIIRGIVSFVETFKIGMKALDYSASFFEEEEGKVEKKDENRKEDKKENKDNKDESKKESKEDNKKGNKKKEKSGGIVDGIIMIISIIFALGIFVLLPFWLSEKLTRYIVSIQLRGLIEGVLRVILFVSYIKIISRIEDIKRVFMYHGAEHKCINCIENGLELNVENARKQTTFHKRCGTTFLLWVMFLSILFFMFIVLDNVFIRMASRIVLVPIIAGISYEIIQIMGKKEGKFFDVISKPGFWMQSLTTKNPDDEMLEVAIASVDAVFDWRTFLEEYDAVTDKAAKKAAKKAEKISAKKAAKKAEKISAKKAVDKAEAKTAGVGTGESSGEFEEKAEAKTEEKDADKPVFTVISGKKEETPNLDLENTGEIEFIDISEEDDDEIEEELEKYFEDED